METRPTDTIPARGRRLDRALGLAALAAGAALTAVMAIRPVSSFDVGYHLAYGEHFLDTRQIVQTDRFIYTQLDPERLAHPAQLGPGCRYDASTDTYHFVNANWLSQVVMAALSRLAGMNALIGLQALMALGIFALVAATCRRGGLSWAWVAPAALLTTLGAYTRYNLRPELFGYLILAGQWCLLVRGRPPWPAVGGAVVLQLLAVNLHSYFLLGVGLAGAMLVDALLRWLWAVEAKRRPAARAAWTAVWFAPALAGAGAAVIGAAVLSYWALGLGLAVAVAGQGAVAAALVLTARARTAPTEPAARLRRMAVTFGAMLAACLANPWFLRGAVMPVQAFFFLHANGIIANYPHPGVLHPWAVISELISPFYRSSVLMTAGKVYVFSLALASLAGAVALLRRRWGWAIALGLMVAVSAAMQRNTAPGVIILLPLSFVIVRDGFAALGPWVRGGVLLAGALVLTVLTAGIEQPDTRLALLLALLPMALLLAAQAWDLIRGLERAKLTRWVCAAAGPAASGAAIAAAAVVGARVVSNAFYVNEKQPWRFGGGVSHLAVPVDPGRWLAHNRPAGRLFCDHDTSSNLMYFSGKRYEVPTLTNTWAMPPYVMAKVLRVAGGQESFREVAGRYEINTVVLRSATAYGPLIKQLGRDPYWTVAHLTPSWVIFVRRVGPTAALAERCAVEPEDFSAASWLPEVWSSDPVPGVGGHRAAGLLYRLAWGDRRMGGGNVSDPDRKLLAHEIAWATRAAEVWRQTLERDAEWRNAWIRTGVPVHRQATLKLANCLGLLGTAKMLMMQWHRRQCEVIAARHARHLGAFSPEERRRLLSGVLQNHADFQRHMLAMETTRLQGLAHWREAAQRLKEAAEEDPDYAPFARNLARLREQKETFMHGGIEVPPIPP